MVSKKLLQEFCQLYADEFGEALTEEKALPIALRLIGLYRTLYGPDPR